MELRRAEPADVERLVDELWLPFAEAMAEFHRWNALATDAREHAVDWHREQVADDDALLLLAVESGDFLGFALARESASPPIFARGPDLSLSSLYVRPERRHEGIATALCDRVADWGRERDCDRIVLSVEAGNESARAFYESRGFRIVRERLARPL